MKITITANDGTEFGTKEECIIYEDELTKKEEQKQAGRNCLLATKAELQKEISKIISGLNNKVSEYRELPSCAIKYFLDNESELSIKFENPERTYISNPLVDLLLRL